MLECPHPLPDKEIGSSPKGNHPTQNDRPISPQRKSWIYKRKIMCRSIFFLEARTEIWWNTTLYANFIDFVKAFDSVYCPALWKILMHYGIPNKIISIIQMLYKDFHAKVICGTELSYSFPIQTGVRQGCLLSPLLFNVWIDWLMKATNRQANRGISWTFQQSLEDLNFADDIALLAQRHTS